MKKLKTRVGNLHIPWEAINDFEDEEFYGFCIDFEQSKEKSQGELHKEIEGHEYTISTYGEIRKNGKKRLRIWKK